MTGWRRIGFVHPSLGLGGAERLVLAAALALQEAGHQVRIFTADLDPRHCLGEARDGSLDVRVHGAWLPVAVGGRLRAPCTLLRTALAACAAMRWHPDLVFCDLAPHLVPLLRLGRAPVLFYGHFPDLLLTAERRHWYRWYRFPLDRLEEWGAGLADRVVVNSRFTAAAFSRAFPGLPASGPEVLHPGVPLPTAVAAIPEGAFDPIVLLSISRFDPKKNLSLAVEALAALRTRLEPCLFARTRLVLAGGLDRRLREQRDEFDRLTALAEARGLAAQVEFRPSVDDGERLGLLASSRAVLYTPEREHFGMVPLEAMAAGRPVVAIRSGGPCETIVDGRTGFLCDATADSFAEALAVLVADGTVARRMGCDAREHVAARFSLSVFARQLDGIVREMTGN